MGNQQWHTQVEFRFDYASYDLKKVIATAEQINEILSRFNPSLSKKKSSEQDKIFSPAAMFQEI